MSLLQPELGRRLTALRKAKNLTQEELAESSHVSARTIQRIEAGEVLPRVSTVRILVAALGERMDTWSNQNSPVMQTASLPAPPRHSGTLLTAVIAGGIYLVAEIIVGALDVVWMTSDEQWGPVMNGIYIGLTVVLLMAYILFIRGFLALSKIFENDLLRISCYLMAAAITILSIIDVVFLGAEDFESLILPYATGAVMLGALCIVFGIALLRLQDSMGELSKIAGILEILMGLCLITVVLFFVSYVILIPAVIVEILVLYKGYEYLTKSREPVIGDQ